MAIPVACRCGRSFSLKDELAGREVRCPQCGETFRVGAPAARPRPQADATFDRDRFLLRQKHLAISEKYVVWDDEGHPILYIERPAHLLRNLLGCLAAFAAAILFAVGVGKAAIAATDETLKVVLGTVAGVGAIFVLFAVAIALYKRRHATVYRDTTKTEPLLEILQDQKIHLVRGTYTVNDAAGRLLATLHKNYVYNLFRKRWYCRGPDGSLLCVAKEDSLILSLMRRWLGPLFGFLRTNFVILEPGTDRVIGEFNRKFTILDRYVLDMTADPRRALDRRIALALGVMLDTGERR
jgi:uncharacterized protein YxjI